MNEFGLYIDITCCGSDYYGSLNNPILSQFIITELKDGESVDKKTISHIISPEENITLAVASKTPMSFNCESSNEESRYISLVDYLKYVYNVLTKCNNNGLYLLGFNHVKYDLEILNRHFEKILNVNPIKWNKNRIIDVHDLCRRVMPWRELGDFTMDTCLYYVSVKNGMSVNSMKPHNPENDNETTKKLLDFCMGKLNLKTYAEVVKYLNSIYDFTEFDFGKYKGMSFDWVYENDRSYIVWLGKNSTDKSLVNKINKKMNEEIPNE